LMEEPPDLRRRVLTRSHQEEMNEEPNSSTPFRRSASSPSLRKVEEESESFAKLKTNVEAFAREAEHSIAEVGKQIQNQLPTPPEKVISIWKEFRDFAFKGSIVDLSVGIIVGGAFGKIVNSMVNDIIMPPIGLLLSGVDFANIFVLLKRGRKHRITRNKYKSLTHAKDDGAIVMGVGVFLNSILNFVVISVIIFIFVRSINRIKRKKEPLLTSCPQCFSPIDKRALRCPFCTSTLDQSNLDSPRDASLKNEDDDPLDGINEKGLRLSDPSNSKPMPRKKKKDSSDKYLKTTLKKTLSSDAFVTSFGF